MQTLDVISVNFWQILVSLCNLVLLFFILKKFLYKPVRKALAARQAEIDKQYSDADLAVNNARISENEWKEKLEKAHVTADEIIKEATGRAERKEESIVNNAREKAAGIIKDAEIQASLETKKARAVIKDEIIDVSAALAEKMLEREISVSDHHDIIDSFISDIGDENEGNK